MMERFQDAEFSWHCCPQKTVTIPRSVCVRAVQCTYYSPNPRLSVLFTHPTPVSPCLAQRGSDMRGSTVHATKVFICTIRDVPINIECVC